MLHEAGSSSSAGCPQGCWIHRYSFRVLLVILHEKDVCPDAQNSLSDPTRPPAAVPTVGPQQKYMGYARAGCSSSDLKLQRCGSLLPLGFCWQSRFAARCLPTPRLTPVQAGGTGARVCWGMCRST